MNWMQHNPKKRQKVMLVGIGSLGVVVLAYQVALVPAMDSLREARQQFRALTERVERDERVLRGETRAMDAFSEAVRNWAERAESIPSHDNPLLWVTEQIYGMARVVGIQVEELRELTAPIPEWIVRPAPAPAAEREEGDDAPDAPAQKPTRRFGPYAVQLAFHADYQRVVELLSLLEKEHPFMSVASLMMTAGRNPDQQSVRVAIEWPRYLGPEADHPRHIQIESAKENP